MSLIRRSSNSAPFLTDSSESAASCLSVRFRLDERSSKSYFAQRVKDLVEIDQNLPLGHLCYIVHALAGIVSYAGILIGKAGEDRRNDFFEIPGYLLKEQ